MEAERIGRDWRELEPGPKVLEAIRIHVRRSAPREACGFIVEAANGETYYQPVDNIHPEPETAFRVADSDYLALEGSALALVHSHVRWDAFDDQKHPAGMHPDCPSEADMRGQLAMALPWGVAVSNGRVVRPPFFWGAFVLDQPLLGRPFRHGIDDCYGAIRKWYWQERGVLLPEFPRAADWWYGERELYLEGHVRAGFRRLDTSEAPILGDVGLTRVGDRRVRTVNHGFVYLGDGTVFHHLPGRLSRREAVGGSLRQVTHWLRFEGAKA